MHNLTAKKNKQGHLLSSWTYDSQDRAVSNSTRDGKGVDINYVSENEVQVTDAYGIGRTYTIWDIDGRKKVTDISSPSGCTSCSNDIVRIEYDSQGRVIEVEYANGLINQYDEFDSRGNPRIEKKAVGTPDEKTTTYTYHPDFRAKLSRTEPSIIGIGSKVTIQDYDDDGNTTPNENPTRRPYRLIEQGFTKDASGQIVSYEKITAYTYNSKGQVLSVDGPLPGSQDTTVFEYATSSGDLLAVNRPLVGTTALSDYDGAGRFGHMMDENGNATIFTYDGRGRINTVTREDDGSVTTTNYNTAGEPTQVIASNGVVTDFEYDTTYGRLTRMLDPLGNYMSYGYDAQGNRTEQSIYNPSAQKVFLQRFDYQSPQNPGKLWKVINPDDTYTEYSYFAGGNIASIKDPADKVTYYDYDILNRLNSVTLPGNVITLYDYDQNDNLKTVTDAEGHTTTYNYDDSGRLLSTASPDTGVTTYAYDISGNLISKTDANGVTTTYIYDTLNRLTGVVYPDLAQNITYTYDEGGNGKGRLTGMSDPSGDTRYTYDAKGNLITEARSIGTAVYTTSYAYDAAGILTGMTYPDSRSVAYELDSAGKVNRVTATKDGTTQILADNISCLPFGPVTGLSDGNGLNQTRSFDQLYRPESIFTEAIQGYEYSRDPAGNITAITDTLDAEKNQAFVYDDLYRLTDTNSIYGSINYAYDGVGNRLSKTHNGLTESYTYIAGTNKLADVNGIDFNYDANGNTTDMGSTTYTYNQNNRLISTAENGAVLGEYVYNALGQRVVKTAGGKEIIFLYDQWGNLMAEADNDGNMINEYFYLNGRLLAALKTGSKIEATVDVDPDTLNLGSNGRWITAFIKLLEEYDVNDIDPATVILNGTIYAEKSKVADNDNDGIPDLMVKFDRQTVCDILAPADEVEITIEGNSDGFGFVGTDTIRVISEGKKHRHRNRTVKPVLTTLTTSATVRQKRKLYFYHLDHLGTPQRIIDESGAVIWSADYQPFGNVNTTITGLENNFRFPGQYYDAEIGLHYNYHRYYDSKIGRYLRADPIGLKGGVNLYTYVLNDPINFFDPDGLIALYGGFGASAGAGWDPRPGNKVNFVSGSGVFYMGSKKDGGSSMGWAFSANAGRIVGASFGGGPMLGINFGDVEDFADKGASTGFIIGLLSFELTVDSSNKWTGFNVGFGLRGWGFGVFGAETRTSIIETDAYSPCN